MGMDLDTGQVLLVEPDLEDMDQLWNLVHLYGSVSSTFYDKIVSKVLKLNL